VQDTHVPNAYDRILWTGTMGEAPYPAGRDGRNRRVAEGRCRSGSQPGLRHV
jgi:hypothetical protein